MPTYRINNGSARSDAQGKALADRLLMLGLQGFMSKDTRADAMEDKKELLDYKDKLSKNTIPENTGIPRLTERYERMSGELRQGMLNQTEIKERASMDGDIEAAKEADKKLKTMEKEAKNIDFMKVILDQKIATKERTTRLSDLSVEKKEVDIDKGRAQTEKAQEEAALLRMFGGKERKAKLEKTRASTNKMLDVAEKTDTKFGQAYLKGLSKGRGVLRVLRDFGQFATKEDRLLLKQIKEHLGRYDRFPGGETREEFLANILRGSPLVSEDE